jgi:hypothetical protein
VASWRGRVDAGMCPDVSQTIERRPRSPEKRRKSLDLEKSFAQVRGQLPFAS